ncbi:MAG: sensor histidine kinase [Anaerolineae bacterium]
MRSLRGKLIFTFLVISVTGMLIAALFVQQSNDRAFDRLLQEQSRARFVQDARNFYETRGNWAGVDPALRALIPQSAPGQPPRQPPPFALADADGRILIPNGPFHPGSVAPPEAMARGIPIEVDGETVGMALPLNLPPPRDPVAAAYVAQVNRALLLGALGATAVAVLIGIFMARMLVRPLAELAAAAQKMSGGDLAQQVPVRTEDELGRLAQAFNEMSDQLAEAARQRRQLTADIAHDLRTPLTVLSGYLEAMQEGTLAATPERLTMMQQEVTTLKRLVSDLRLLSLADAGELTLQKEPVAVADLLAQAQAAYQVQAAQKGVSLRVEPTAVLPTLSLDPERMRQVLGNLVSNALRHTPAAGEVALTAVAGEQSVSIQVTDTGTGIPAADLPRIFNRFYRGDKSRQEGEGASGLGLAIARALVAAHGGELTAVSPVNEDGGSQFIVTLPFTD